MKKITLILALFASICIPSAAKATKSAHIGYYGGVDIIGDEGIANLNYNKIRLNVGYQFSDLLRVGLTYDKKNYTKNFFSPYCAFDVARFEHVNMYLKAHRADGLSLGFTVKPTINNKILFDIEYNLETTATIVAFRFNI